MECFTWLCTPIQQLEWSAIWIATIHNPKNGLDWQVDCTPKTIVDLDCGLHSKNTQVSNALILGYPLRIPLPVRMSYVIKFPTHTKNTPSSFWISLLSDSATKVWSWITRVGGRMSVLLRSWGRDEISSEPKSVTYDWIINFPTYHTAWSISTKSVLQSTEESPGIPQMLLRWHKTYSNGWVVYRQRDTDL